MVNHLRYLVKENRKTFISILLLTMLGVGFFVGMKSTVPNLEYTVENYYEKYNVFDLELTSSIGFTEEDIQSFQSIKNIESIEGSYKKDFVMKGKTEDYVLRVHSYLKDSINNLEVVKGTLPNKIDEIVLEDALFEKQNYKIGDTIEIKSDLLKNQKCKIVGSIKSPLYLSNDRGSTNLLSGKVNYYAYVNKENVESNYYSSLYMKIKNKKDLNNTLNQIKKVGKKEIETRYDSLIKEYQDKIEKGQAEFDSKKKEYEQKISDYEDQIANAEVQIESADESIPTLDEARNILANKQNELNKVKQELDAAKQKIDNARSEYNNAVNEYNTYNNLSKQLENSTDPADQFMHGYYQTVLYYAKQSLDSSKEELEAKETEYNYAFAEYQRVENTLNSSSPEEYIQKAKAEVNHQKELLNQKKKELEESKKRTNEEFISYQNQLNDAKDYLKLISVNGWTINKKEDIPSYKQYLSDIRRIEKIGDYFPIIFYIVAVFITLTNITRIVTKDREDIGLYKALGYSNKEIMKDYLLFSFLSCFIGSILGAIIGTLLIPRVFYNVYTLIYHLPQFKILPQFVMTLIAILIAIVLILISTYGSIKKTIQEVPASLLRPKNDTKGQRVFLEKTKIWESFDFTNKITFRNMFKYPKRFIMMILGIAGCISLIVSGFNMRTSISNIIPLQFEHIFDIDAEVFFKDSISRNEINSEKQRFSELKEVDATILSYVKYATINHTNQKINLVVPEDKDLLLDFVLLEDKGKLLELEEDGAIITRKIATTQNIKIGDTIELKDAENNLLKVKIDHIVDNYVDNYIYITNSYYESLVGNSPKYNTILVRMKDDSYQEEALSKEFNKNNNVSYLIYTSSSKVLYESLSKSLNYIVYILVLSAVILAFVVLYNLNTLNVEERKREIATIEVLGFYKRETYQYIENEIKRLTGIGIAVGIITGYFFSNFLIKNCELDNVMYDYTLHIENYLYAVGITIFFMIITSLLSRKYIKKINMIESLKKVE